MKKLGIVFFSTILLISCSVQSADDETKKTTKAKNIILLIGDGMGTTHIFAGLTANKGQLNIERFKNIGFSKTQSANSYITDSGAGGTAISTGYKTYNRAIGVDNDTVPQMTILEYAEQYNKATGLVATSTMVHATPASFISHQPSRYLYEDIAADFMKTDIEVFIGGGLKHFNAREDSVDLTEELIAKGYQIVTSIEGLSKINSGKIAGLLYEDAPPKMLDGRGDMLEVSSMKAIEILSLEENGFFLMIEGSQIDWGGHDNNIDYITSEMIDFDIVVGKVLDFAEKDGNTLVIVTADHETGGLALDGGSIAEGTLDASFSSDHHTGVMVPVFAYGPGSECFGGIYENTELFFKMMKAFGFTDTENNN